MRSMKEIMKIRLGVASSFLIEGEKGYILVDAGLKKKEKKLLRFLKKNRINPMEIKLIVITHVHGDHVGSLKSIQEITHAKVLVHQEEKEFLIKGKSHPAKPISKFYEKISSFMPEKSHRYDAVEPDIVVEDNYSLQDFGIKAKIIHTPGHTKGSISLIDEQGNAFIGDIAMGFPMNFKAGLPIIAENLDEVKKSWKRILEEGAKTLHLSHGGIVSSKVLKKLLEKKEKK